LASVGATRRNDRPARYVYDLTDTRIPARIGNKAENLRFLIQHGVPVPAAWVCTWDAYLDYEPAGAVALEQLRSELASCVRPGRSYAVRSSANVEDDLGHSFAGQFKTHLHVEGVDNVLDAVQSVWHAACSPDVQAYLERHSIPQERLKMAVLIQEMVPPYISGVSFSKNPVTGLDEVIVEAVEGSGDALVQSGATPRRWVSKWGTWLQKPDGDGIPLALIEQVVQQTKSIARSYGKPVDLEWVYDGQLLYWVQVREITALEIPVYSNRIAREVLPGIIKPLIWSVNVPLVNGAWVRLFTELIGPNDIDPLKLAGHFYYRAYFNMAAIGQIFELLGMPRETLELLMGIEVEGPEKPSFRPSVKTYTLLPKMLRFVVDKLRFERRLKTFLVSMKGEFQDLPNDQVQAMSEVELLSAIDRNVELAREAAQYNIVVPLLAMIYSRMLKGQFTRAGVDYEAVDVTGGMAEMELFDPSVHLARLHAQYLALDPELQAAIAESGYAELKRRPEVAPLLEGVDGFLGQFGHLSDSGNDFSARPWREDPDLILDMVATYAQVEARIGPRQHFEDLELSPWRRAMARPLYRRARRYRLYREAVSSLYTYGYGRLRDYFLSLGDRFAQRRILEAREDIFYLYLSEVREIVQAAEPSDSVGERIAQRKAEIEQVRDIALPEIIYGDKAPPVENHVGRHLRGIPTSRGHHTGAAKVLRGIQDLSKLESGDVLVIPYSDVGWTPLFAKAGAVIAESGGILSHSSIVAREYGIPAVVSVPDACQLADYTIVSVDGYRGEVQVHGPGGAVASPDQ
jgi:phosphoenolpyruvate synthase/pyruvate phosphate dikinase